MNFLSETRAPYAACRQRRSAAGSAWRWQGWTRRRLTGRRDGAMTTVGTGKYTYHLIENWAKLPAGQTFGNVSAVATDSQDRVYVFQRQDPPILVFDRDGSYRSCWGINNF